ncbi:hypothetical protein [Clostridium tetani]|uniref:hypothetical protein n=1 Tax=Clostridium tetani TaxID=1513 RepID=UPI00100A5A90|nr:hypothetical protein [Clostridium tetani]RXM69441.1 hypothetical protein DP139_10395 [Clostridium tetani]
MILYDLLKNLINNNYYEKEDMTNKLNVFYTFNQIAIEQYSELIAKVSPSTKEDVGNQGLNVEDTIKNITK